MDNFKKNFKFFSKSHWTAAIVLSILNALFVPSVIAGGLTEANKSNNGDGEPEFGVKVTIKDPDASERNSKLKKKLSFLRGELENVHRENDVLCGEKSDLKRKLEESLKEKEVLRKELIEILEKFEEQKAEYDNLRLSFASIYAEDEKKNIVSRERELLEELRLLSVSGLKLATVTANLCDYIDSVLKNLKIDSLELARIKYKIDETRQSSEAMTALANKGKSEASISKCRILAVDDDLQVAVLNVGFVQGVRNGLTWHTGKDRKIRLRVISVRPLVSAAMLINGSLKDIAPGMEAFTSSAE